RGSILVHLSDGTHQPAQSVCCELRRGPVYDRAYVLAIEDNRRDVLDDPSYGLLPAGFVRRLRHLSARTVSNAFAQYRDELLLQRGTIRRCNRPTRPWSLDKPCVSRSRRDALCRNDDVGRVSDWFNRFTVRARNERSAPSRLTGLPSNSHRCCA